MDGWMDGLVVGWSWAGEHGIRSCLPLWGSIVFGVPGDRFGEGESLLEVWVSLLECRKR